MKQLFFTLVAGCLLVACTGKKDDVQDDDTPTDMIAEPDTIEIADPDTLQLFEEREIPQSADVLFDDFFFSFATDERFQMQRVVFPLHGEGEEGEQTLSQEQWAEARLFSRQPFFSIIYDRDRDMEIQKDTNLTQVSVEWIHLNDDRLERYNFNRRNGQWLLTDFQSMAASQTPNGDFIRFYAQFVTDSVFQRESLCQPLRLISEADDEFDEGGEMELSPDEWFEFRKEMPMPEHVMMNINYGQPALSENKKVLMVEGMSNGLYVRYHFDRLNERWRLMTIEN
ncbi:MAG: DUF4348 domain-containing protein [Prevotellaceae bacterium]|nr:DUF4348 domain-containing protein [Prevotellaceae bacterium]